MHQWSNKNNSNQQWDTPHQYRTNNPQIRDQTDKSYVFPQKTDRSGEDAYAAYQGNYQQGDYHKGYNNNYNAQKQPYEAHAEVRPLTDRTHKSYNQYHPSSNYRQPDPYSSKKRTESYRDQQDYNEDFYRKKKRRETYGGTERNYNMPGGGADFKRGKSNRHRSNPSYNEQNFNNQGYQNQPKNQNHRRSQFQKLGNSRNQRNPLNMPPKSKNQNFNQYPQAGNSKMKAYDEQLYNYEKMNNPKPPKKKEKSLNDYWTNLKQILTSSMILIICFRICKSQTMPASQK